MTDSQAQIDILSHTKDSNQVAIVPSATGRERARDRTTVGTPVIS